MVFMLLQVGHGTTVANEQRLFEHEGITKDCSNKWKIICRDDNFRTNTTFIAMYACGHRPTPAWTYICEYFTLTTHLDQPGRQCSRLRNGTLKCTEMFLVIQ